jgi:lactoylglutathione lyase
MRVGAQWLELIADNGPGRPTGVVDHLALEVDDLDTWLLQLREHGVRVLDQQPIHVPALSARILFCLGPDDERIELFQQRADPAGV